MAFAGVDLLAEANLELAPRAAARARCKAVVLVVPRVHRASRSLAILDAHQI